MSKNGKVKDETKAGLPVVEGDQVKPATGVERLPPTPVDAGAMVQRLGQQLSQLIVENTQLSLALEEERRQNQAMREELRGMKADELARSVAVHQAAPAPGKRR